jgi:16S rRNA (guanine527-N7)-methyltransferase
MAAHIVHLEPWRSSFSRPVEQVAADLEYYAELLVKWQKVQNLVSRETLRDLWQRHFVDSLQVLGHLKDNDKQFVDLGSGGGLPALPLAIALKNSDRRFLLVEPNGRKASFLRTVARDLGLNVTVESRRIEQLDSRETGLPDVITSRALASLTQLCAWMQPFFGPTTRAILHKGREHVEELTDANALWNFDVIISPSSTDSAGVLLTLSELRGKTL